MQIEIDFEVFKELTVRRGTEATTYNDVIRELLGLPMPFEADLPVPAQSDGQRSGGYAHRGLHLSEGTELRAAYKGKEYRAAIRQGQWIDENGQDHSSPSAAASAITGNNVNGWRFWEARRPGETQWRKLDALPKIALI